MKTTISLLLVGCLFCLTLYAQQDLSIQWQRTIGTENSEGFNDIANDTRNIVTACSDGGYAITVLCPSDPATTCDRVTWTGERLWLIKFNKFGVKEWERCYGALIDSYYKYVSPGGLIQTTDNGFLIVGGTNFEDGDFATNHGTYDGFVIKTNATGGKEWSRCYGGSSVDGFSSVVQDYDGNYVIAGQAASNNGDVAGIHWSGAGSSGKDAWIVKISPTGSIIWQQCVDNRFDDERFWSVKMTHDSGFVAVGSITARLSKSGVLLWQRSEVARDVAVDSYNNIYSTSNDRSSDVSKLNAGGKLLWTRSLFPGLSSGFSGPAVVSLQVVNDTTIMVSGTTDAKEHVLNGMHWTGTASSTHDIFLAQIDSSARVNSMKCFGGSGNDGSVDFIPTMDNGYLILGYSDSRDGDVLQSFGNGDYWLVKVGNFNTIKGKLFYDYNNNSIQDPGEDAFTNVFVTSEKNGSVNGSYSSDGTFKYTVDTGVQVTKPIINLPYYNLNPTSFNTVHTSYGHTDSVDFAIVPIPGITDLSVSLGSQTAQRPGFTNKLYLTLSNNGTTVIQNAFVGILTDKKMMVTSFDSAAFFRTGDTLFWQVNNLEPRHTKTVTINTRNPAPPAMTIGDSLFHVVLARPFANNSSDLDNQDTIRQNIVGSYDPNNKLDDVGGIFYNDRYKNGDGLLYTINFQNTGTDTAFAVVVRDTVSSLFNVQSIQMVGASHPYTLTINGNRLQWTFKDIRLVDSVTNEPKSHGYFMFRIKPKAGLNVNQLLSNRVSIYFDYNLPVLTNKNDVKILLRPLARPIITGLSSAYCRKPATLTGKLMNPPGAGSGVTILVMLNNTPLTVAADSTFSFDGSSLAFGSHTISAYYTQGSVSSLAQWPFNVTDARLLDLILSANITTVTNITQPVIITATNLSGGTNLLYTYARDRNFINILRPESSDNIWNVNPGTLSAGSNTIYGRISANGQCYTQLTDTDSIQIIVDNVTGIINVEALGQSIKVYPDPFNNEVTINGLKVSKTYQVLLLNAHGNKVYTATIKNRSSYLFNATGLPAGVYILHLKSEQKNLGAVTVIKQ